MGILQVTKRLKQNAAGVPINLGGGQHGYIFLILVDERWKNIPGTIPFVKPVDSEVFVTAVTTNVVIATEKAQ